jgi:HTH-type transcriptional regulator, transcriptional repressor of NAD biosynthesis genes
METTYNRSLVIGKFIPPHVGHIRLMKRAIDIAHDHLIVVCQHSSDKIPADLRKTWIETIIPGVNVVVFNGEHLPQSDEADINISKRWAEAIKDKYGIFDVIVTSEKYGDTYAKAAGIEHYMWDYLRKVYPVRGSDIMKSPVLNWSYIPDEIKYYFVQKICVIGPESTGKSTLTKQLANYYDSYHVPELARDWLKDRQPRVEEFPIFGMIQAGNVLTAMLNAERSGMVFSDTDALVTRIFLPEYFPESPESMPRKDNTWGFLRQIEKYMKYDFYILLAPTVPWVDDGSRVFSDENTRWNLFIKYRHELDQMGVPYVEIDSKDWNTRFLDAQDGLLKFLQGEYK